LGNKKKDKFFKKHEGEQELASVSINARFPKFSFEFCFGSDRSIDKAVKEVKLSVIEKVVYLSQIPWVDIKALARENGFEKINKGSFKKLPNIPKKFDAEDKIVVFRLPSGQGRLIGYIEEDTFFVVWIDTKFDMYNHG